jgi:hypothetical protein
MEITDLGVRGGQIRELGVNARQVNVKLCLAEYHAMKSYWGSGGVAPRILNLNIR